MDLSIIFAWIVTVLAGLAVVGALLYAISWEWFAFRRLLERHRKPGPAYDPTSRWWREHSAMSVPERHP